MISDIKFVIHPYLQNSYGYLPCYGKLCPRSLNDILCNLWRVSTKLGRTPINYYYCARTEYAQIIYTIHVQVFETSLENKISHSEKWAVRIVIWLQSDSTCTFFTPTTLNLSHLFIKCFLHQEPQHTSFQGCRSYSRLVLRVCQSSNYLSTKPKLSLY